jgi:hypothetical protein
VPLLTILTPTDLARFAAGASIAFAGAAQDVEDGNISSRIVWFSSLEGQIGAGATMTRTLGAGVHIITATVIDSTGNMRSSRISVVIE